MTAVVTDIPGYLAGTWTIDPTHSEVAFTVRHLMVSKVRGRFTKFEGHIVTEPDPFASTVEATVDLSSIDTASADRDAHLRTADFFEVDSNPTMTYRSTGVRHDGDDLILDGDLTLHGVTRPVPLKVEVNGFQPDTPFGDTRVGFSAEGELNRTDFGISFNMALEGGGIGLGEKVRLHIEVEAILDTPES
ncbi:MAG TPA: YceI family protein [Acidimicrobiia bacterium]|nr:YceI family protein [Acidimicrobiia bacterium]